MVRRVALWCLFVACCLGLARGQETRTVTQPFIGVTLTRIETTVPRTLSMNLVEIDLTVPGIGFAVTPSNGAAAGDTVGLTTRQFLTQQGVQLAVNGGFSAWVSGSNYNVEGLAARQGVVYSEFQEFRTFALNISPENVATIIRASGTSGTAHSPPTTLYNVLPGEGRLLRNGTLIQYDGDTNQPRTGVGLGADETRLYLMTVDGRNSGHSLGVTRPELADFMRLNGVYNAFNLDGGGSTTLVVADPQPRLVNVPVGVNDVPGTERVVGSNFGVYALPMPLPAAVTINVSGGTSTQAAAGHPFLVNALSLTKTGTGTLVLDAGNTFTAATEVRGGTLRLAKATGLQASPTTVLAGGRFDVVPGLTPRMPSLTLAAGSTLSGSVTLGPAGISGLVAAAGANLTAATLAVTAGGSATISGTGTVGLLGLAVDPAGRLEIGSARISVAAGGFDIAAVRAAVAAGVTGTSGITSAAVASAMAAGQQRTIGWRVGSDGVLSLGFAAPGDANLDGLVNLTDISMINSGGKFGQGSSSGAVWSQGDFNHSGGVTLADVNLLNQANVFLQGSYLPVSGLGAVGTLSDPGSGLLGPDGLVVSAVVPEPDASLPGLAAAALALVVCRRRSRGACVMVAACAATGIAAAAETHTRPNVVVILVDDVGFSDIGCYGGEIPTPGIDALAADGLRFSAFYNTARCSTTRAALLTGLYPHQAGMGHLDGMRVPESRGTHGRLHDRCVTLAEVLAAAGYHTSIVGKWHLGQQHGTPPWERGFRRTATTRYGELAFPRERSHPATKLVALDGREVPADSPEVGTGDWYATELFTDWALAFVDDARVHDMPFFLYVAHGAAHFPLRAPADAVARHRGRYSAGWDRLRAERHRRQIDMGLLDPAWQLAPRPPDVPAWDSLSAADRDRFDSIMAVYAAMIECVDASVSRLVAGLSDRGVLDDTLILFLSDNGGNAESGPRGIAEGDNLGGPESRVFLGMGWATLANTPFRRFKHFTHEGGIATPLVVHWPRGIPAERRGTIEHAPGHVIDVMPTLVEVCGAAYPAMHRGHSVIPYEGASLVPAFSGRPLHRWKPLFWEHEGNKAIRSGRWKGVLKHGGPWELYDMQSDRTELRDQAAAHPAVLELLVNQWGEWAASSFVDAWTGPPRTDWGEEQNDRIMPAAGP